MLIECRLGKLNLSRARTRR